MIEVRESYIVLCGAVGLDEELLPGRRHRVAVVVVVALVILFRSLFFLKKETCSSIKGLFQF